MTETTRAAAHELIILPNRGVLRLSGPDRTSFLQGLVSNNVESVGPDNAVYVCMLTPQGKFLHDFFLVEDGDSLLIDCEGERSDDLLRRLRMYKLRAKIDLDDVSRSFMTCAIPDMSTLALSGLFYRDPRHSELGYRVLAQDAPAAPTGSFNDYDRRRIALAVPDGSRDMEIGKAILLENNIDLLNGIAWDKGCYTGQELTARTHYRGLIKKRLAPVRITGNPPATGAPLIENGIEIGEMRGSRGDLGLALLKLDTLRQKRPILCGDVVLTPELPEYLARFLDQAAA